MLLIDNAGKTPTDWSRDDYLLYTSLNDVWALPPPSSGRTQPLQVTNTPFIESAARFSPDGRWIAYQSTDSANGQDVVHPVVPGRWPQTSGLGGRRNHGALGTRR